MPLQRDPNGTLILGGGPAGAAAAIALARAGHPLTLIEREATSRNKVCGEFLSAEALALLSRLGIRPDPHGAKHIHTVRLASRAHNVTATLPFPALSLTRRCLDGLLLRAAEDAGATVRRGVVAELLSPCAAGWQATLSNGESLTAKRVILATGKHDLRGLPRPAGVQSDLVAMKMYFRLAPRQSEALAGTVELLLHPQGYTGLQPVEDGTANLTALVRRTHLVTLGGWEGLLAEIRQSNHQAARRLAGAEALLPRPLALSAIPYGFVRRAALASTLYAAGDQAAVIPSFTGDGMSIALYTGMLAADAILDGEPATTYQRRLHRTVRWQVARATALSRTLVTMPGQTLLMAAARAWPGGVRVAAQLTRLPQAAVPRFGEAESSSGHGAA